MSDNGLDYFSNHARARKFPWSIYHRPLETDLADFLREVAHERPAARVLVIGCGLFHELDRVPQSLRLTVVDIDARAIEAIASYQDSRIEKLVALAPEDSLDSLHAQFDAVYAKEVIEHIPDTEAYLAGIRRVLKPGGSLWLSTPNYGEPWLPLIENTVLEWIARRSGYTRKGIHPSPFSRGRLKHQLAKVGFHNVRVRPVAVRLSLVARASA